MKLFAVFALFLAFVAFASAYESAGYFKDPAHPGKCVYDGLVLSPGEEGKLKGRCERFLCDNSEGFGRIQGCGIQEVGPPCKMGDYVDVEAPYGECCKRHVTCPGSDEDFIF